MEIVTLKDKKEYLQSVILKSGNKKSTIKIIKTGEIKEVSNKKLGYLYEDGFVAY